MALCFVALLMPAFIETAAAQGQPAAKAAPGDDLVERVLAEADRGRGETSADAKADLQIYPETLPSGLLDKAGEKEMQAAFRAYYAYRVQGYEHRARNFEWQLFSSKIIFVLVLMLVGCGVYLSWRQFELGLRQDRLKPDVGKDERAIVEETAHGAGGALDHRTTISVGSKGIEVSSSILGVIILTISMIFFYLYLIYVYPVFDTF